MSASTAQTFEDENICTEEYSFSIDNSNENNDFIVALQESFSFPSQVWPRSNLQASQKVFSAHHNSHPIRAPPTLHL